MQEIDSMIAQKLQLTAKSLTFYQYRNVVVEEEYRDLSQSRLVNSSFVSSSMR